MSTEHPATPAPIALQPTEGEALWFMGFLATIKATADGTAGRVAVIHHLGPQDAGSPLHVHHREDEWFYVIDGELTVWVGGQVIRAPAGSFVFGPQGTPHTFTVSSPDGASFLLVTEPGGFEAFMRTVAEPARSLTLPPPPDSPPTPHSSPPSPPNTASKSSARPASHPETASWKSQWLIKGTRAVGGHSISAKWSTSSRGAFLRQAVRSPGRAES